MNDIANIFDSVQGTLKPRNRPHDPGSPKPRRHEFTYDEVAGLPYWESLQAVQEGGPLTDETILSFFRRRGTVSAVLLPQPEYAPEPYGS